MKQTPLLVAVLSLCAGTSVAAPNTALSQLQGDDGASATPVAAPAAVLVQPAQAPAYDAAIPKGARPFAKSEAGEDLFLVSKLGDWGSFYSTAQDKAPRRWYIAFQLSDPPEPSNFVQVFEDPATPDHPHPLTPVNWNKNLDLAKARSQIWRFTKPETADKVGFWAMIQYPDESFCQPMAWWGESYSKEAAQKTCDAYLVTKKTAIKP